MVYSFVEHCRSTLAHLSATLGSLSPLSKSVVIMSGTELFDGDEREFEGTQFECNVYQTSSGSDLESGEEPNIPSTEEIIKSAFSSKRKGKCMYVL